VSVASVKARLPNSTSRTAIIGTNGTGKTQFAVWLLSTRDLDKRPWIIFDYKGDELIEAIDPVEISIFGSPPKKPGLYVVRPVPELHDKAVEAFMWKCWAQEHLGIYIDEGYMIGQRNGAFNALLTQGRSKHIEMIILSQRPRWMSQFVFSEAKFFAVFNLNLKDDRAHVSGYIGDQPIKLLPRFHCLWYDGDGQRADIMTPVPDFGSLVARFEARLSRRARAI
jgi:DNA helicase HerA-like ATPase